MLRSIFFVLVLWGFAAGAHDTGEVQTGEEFQVTNEHDGGSTTEASSEGGPAPWPAVPAAADWTEDACILEGSTEACMYKARRIIRRHQKKGARNHHLIQANAFLSRAAGLGHAEAGLILGHIVRLRNAAPVGTALADIEYSFNLDNPNPKAVRREFRLKSLTDNERNTLHQRFGIRELEDIHSHPHLSTDPTAVRQILDLTVEASDQTKNLQALTIAADSGNMHSRTLLGQSSAAVGDHTTAEAHFTQACTQGYGEACVNLGYLHYVQEDHLAAVSVLNRSCAEGHARSCFYSYRVHGQVRKRIRKSFYGARPGTRFINTTADEVHAGAQPVALVKSMRTTCEQNVAEACSDLGFSLVPREVRRQIKKEDFEHRGDLVTETRWLAQYVITPALHKTVKYPYNKAIKPTATVINQFVLQPVGNYTVRPVIKFTKFWRNSFRDGTPEPKQKKNLKDKIIVRPGEVAEAFRKACELDGSLTAACRYNAHYEASFQPLED